MVRGKTEKGKGDEAWVGDKKGSEKGKGGVRKRGMKGKSGRTDEENRRGRVKEGGDREPRSERKEMDIGRESLVKRRGAESGESCGEGAQYWS